MTLFILGRLACIQSWNLLKTLLSYWYFPLISFQILSGASVQKSCSCSHKNSRQIHDKFTKKGSLSWLSHPWEYLASLALCWVFVYELRGCGFISRCCHLDFRYGACFKQGVPWHSGNYWVWIHSETCKWHDKNIQSLTYLKSVRVL